MTADCRLPTTGDHQPLRNGSAVHGAPMPPSPARGYLEDVPLLEHGGPPLILYSVRTPAALTRTRTASGAPPTPAQLGWKALVLDLCWVPPCRSPIRQLTSRSGRLRS
jgi:hypothetical protein